ncbi:aspartate/glutamate racemase family protein [Alteromonas sp. CYL-A6]|uniref:aspartate/glutamate racemase family protein n=1 Tax=Alteromonas nitratireducens TaxID=3390813 RepID=UPI0034AB870B
MTAHHAPPLKTIGLLGGMSWESTATYYSLINRLVNQRLGGLHSARILLSSVDFAEVALQQQQNDWAASAALLREHARKLETAGAKLIVLCTNTMHKVADEIAAGIQIPFLHIADALVQALNADGITRIGLLGTRFTMQQAFYRERLQSKGIEVLVPDDAQQDEVHRIIFDELCAGTFSPASRQRYLDVIDELSQRGAQAVALGCTEIGLLVKPEDTAVPLYDTTTLHASAAVSAALNTERLRTG